MKIIDLENSFIDFIGDNNSWRTNIKSVLECKKNKKTYYLAKETRAQQMTKNPFKHNSRFEFLGLVDNLGTTNFIRTSAVDGYKGTFQIVDPDNADARGNEGRKLKNNIYINYKDVGILDFNQLQEILHQKKIKNIFCKIDYSLNDEEYSIISKCEYINYNTSIDENDKYVQTAMGYVPFVLNKNIFIGYVVKKVGSNYQGNLEFLLRTKNNIFTQTSQNILKKIIKKFINQILFFAGKNEFDKYLSLDNSNLTFFSYD